MNPLLLRYGPYLIAVLALIGLGWWGGWHFGSGRWRGLYADLQAQGWQAQAQAERAARVAIQAQLEAAHTTLARNTGITNDLEQKAAATAAERDRFRAERDRLRAEAARSAAAGASSLSEADRRFAALEASAAQSLGECQDVLIEGLADGTDNADQLDGLAAAVTPQL